MHLAVKVWSLRSYHLEPLLHGGSALKVGGSGVNVVFDLLLGQIDHVGRVEGLAVELEVGLISIHEAIEPRQELLGAVVGVQNDGDAVGGSNAANVVGSGNTTSNGGGLAIVAHTLTGEVSGTTLRKLQDDGGLGIAGSLEGGNNGGGRGDVLAPISECLVEEIVEVDIQWREWQSSSPERTRRDGGHRRRR